jgi:hypothetical protein
MDPWEVKKGDLLMETVMEDLRREIVMALG